jgi:epidermal growth factor receptor substrate 15
MADLNKDQKLDPHEFVIAMFLIANRKRGLELPPVVPESLIASAWPDPSSPTQLSLPPGSSTNPAISPPAVRLFNIPFSLCLTNLLQGSEWIIPPSEKVKYDDLFKKTDSDLDGFVSG